MKIEYTTTVWRLWCYMETVSDINTSKTESVQDKTETFLSSARACIMKSFQARMARVRHDNFVTDVHVIFTRFDDDECSQL